MYVTENLRSTLIQREFKIDVLLNALTSDVVVELHEKGSAIANEMMEEATKVTSHRVTMLILDDVEKVIKNLNVLVSTLVFINEKHELNMN